MQKERKIKINKSVFLYALGASLVFHASLALSSVPIFVSKQSSSQVAEKDPAFERVKIIQFYAEDIPEEILPDQPPLNLEGIGLKRKIASHPKINDDITYATYIRDLIVGELRYPAEKKREGREEEVQVLFVLNSNGKILKLNVASGLRSADESFNEAALSAVRLASAFFPPFPETVKKKEQRFSFILLFHPEVKG